MPGKNYTKYEKNPDIFYNPQNDNQENIEELISSLSFYSEFETNFPGANNNPLTQSFFNEMESLRDSFISDFNEDLEDRKPLSDEALDKLEHYLLNGLLLSGAIAGKYPEMLTALNKSGTFSPDSKEQIEAKNAYSKIVKEEMDKLSKTSVFKNSLSEILKKPDVITE